MAFDEVASNEIDGTFDGQKPYSLNNITCAAVYGAISSWMSLS
jgi:hypothetical protein